MITVTSEAISKIKEISIDEAIGHLTIRIKVIGGGCAGMTQDMYFEDLPITDMDETFKQDGITVVVDPLSMQYLDGVTLDFTEGPISSGFKFINPNVKTTCGCGNSVGF